VYDKIVNGLGVKFTAYRGEMLNEGALS